MGGRSSSSGMAVRGAPGSGASSGFNSTNDEKKVARNLNSGNYSSAERTLSEAGPGSTVQVGSDSYVKVPSGKWQGTDNNGGPKLFTTSVMVQEVTAQTYDGAKAKVKISKSLSEASRRTLRDIEQRNRQKRKKDEANRRAIRRGMNL